MRIELIILLIIAGVLFAFSLVFYIFTVKKANETLLFFRKVELIYQTKIHKDLSKSDVMDMMSPFKDEDLSSESREFISKMGIDYLCYHYRYFGNRRNVLNITKGESDIWMVFFFNEGKLDHINNLSGFLKEKK